MKYLVCLLIVMSAFIGTSQVIYANNKRPDFQSLLKNGLIYIKSGDEIKDTIFIESFTKYWKFSSFKVYDGEDPEFELTTEDIVITTAGISGENDLLCIVQMKHLMGEEFSKYSSLGYMNLEGFNQKTDSLSVEAFIDQYVISFNDSFQSVKESQTEKVGAPFFKEQYEVFLPESKVLKEKTLLIVDDTKDYISEKALDKYGIKYKHVTSEEYANLKQGDLSKYCLFYFSYNQFTEMSIYDLETNKMIFVRHFVNAKSNFGFSDAGDIADQFN